MSGGACWRRPPGVTSRRSGSNSARVVGRTEQDAQLLVDLLVAHVFHFLTTPGLKRLTREDLKRVAAESLAPRDTALVRLLETVAERTSQQLTRIESASDQILGRVNELGPALTAILQHLQGASPHAVDLLTRAIDEPPHAPALFAERLHLVAQIELQIERSVLAAINGPAGMGKTMLALRAYLRLRRPRTSRRAQVRSTGFRRSRRQGVRTSLSDGASRELPVVNTRSPRIAR